MTRDLRIIGSDSTARVESSVDSFSTGLQNYLEELKLPSENILVAKEERIDVIGNLPRVVSRLSDEQKQDSMYISKFVAACGAGLFDAALNFLWNETVLNLRKKVVRFDLDYFLDSIITDARRRESFKSEDDLKKLDEWELIKGCKDTGIITEIGYKHLDYIRDMRNYASAAHPNHNDLDGYQLISWLQTCIKEVLGKEPSGPVLEVKRLLNNLRKNELSKEDIPPIISNIERLPVELVDSTIRAAFGMYTDPKLDAKVRNNLKLVASSFWDNCSEESKNNLALKYAVFSANADIDRKPLAYEFLVFVKGLSYLPEEQIIVEMDRALDNLFMVHNGFNNFHNEPPHARLLYSYVPPTGNIPKQILYKYVKVITMCSIGNGYGISNSANFYYKKLLSRFKEKQIIEFTKTLNDSDMKSRLQFSTCAENYKKLAQDFLPRITEPSLIRVLENIINSSIKRLSKLSNETEFKKLISEL